MMIKKMSYGLFIALLGVICVSIASQHILATSQNDASIAGSSFSSQVVTGTARIISSLSQLSKICKGDIVVACMTDASWEPILCLAGGIITDQGDSNCHAAVFGKRMGIPVIVGTGNATTIIIDGQKVTIDCSKNSFYTDSTVAEIIMPHHGMTYKSGVHYAPVGHSTTSSHSLVSTTQSFGQRSNKEGCQRVNHFNITKERIQQDQYEIVKYIYYVSGRISLGSKTPKWAAYMWEGIEEDVYDSMPVLFFKYLPTSSKINEGLNQLDFDDDALQYIQEGIEKFEERKEKPVHPNLLGRISYRRMVDRLDVSEDYKQILKKRPIKMDEFVKNNIVKKDEYIRFNMLNLTTQYYLKKHGIIK